jgi:hypothetical protein
MEPGDSFFKFHLGNGIEGGATGLYIYPRPQFALEYMSYHAERVYFGDTLDGKRLLVVANLIYGAVQVNQRDSKYFKLLPSFGFQAVSLACVVFVHGKPVCSRDVYWFFA